MASSSQNHSRRNGSKNRIGAECPPIQAAVVLWDDPWPRRQLLKAKEIAKMRKQRGSRDQHDAPWFVKMKTSMRYLTPIFLFGLLIIVAIGFSRWSKNQDSTLGGAMDAFGGKQGETVYDGVEPSPTPPPIPTDIPPTSTVFVMPQTNDESMAPPYQSARETATATAQEASQ